MNISVLGMHKFISSSWKSNPLCWHLLLFLHSHFITSIKDIGLLKWLNGKEPACQWRRCKRCWFDPWVEKIPCRRKWQPTPLFLPGKSHGQRNQVGYSPWACKEVDTAEHWIHTHSHTHTHTHTHTHLLPNAQVLLQDYKPSVPKESSLTQFLGWSRENILSTHRVWWEEFRRSPSSLKNHGTLMGTVSISSPLATTVAFFFFFPPL